MDTDPISPSDASLPKTGSQSGNFFDGNLESAANIFINKSLFVRQPRSAALQHVMNQIIHKRAILHEHGLRFVVNKAC